MHVVSVKNGRMKKKLFLKGQFIVSYNKKNKYDGEAESQNIIDSR